MSTTSTIRTLRDLALTVGGVALTALVARELADQPGRRPATGDGLPAARHGWLHGLDGVFGDRSRRLRPATAAEAAASAASRTAGDGGWIALVGGHVRQLTDPAVLVDAGRYTPDRDNRVDIVYVTDSPQPAMPAPIPTGGVRQAVLDLIRAWAPGTEFGPSDVARALPEHAARSRLVVAHLLAQLLDDGELQAGDREGTYRLPTPAPAGDGQDDEDDKDDWMDSVSAYDAEDPANHAAASS